MTTPNSEGVASALGLHSTPGSNSLQKAGTYLQENIAALLHQWAWQDIGLQLLIVIVSVFVGLFLSKRIRRVCLSYLPEPGNTAMSAYFKRLGLAFIANVSFSFLSGVVLAIGAYVMVSVFGYSPVSMVVLRLAYSLFFAYALLCLCLGFLTVITGENVITPGMRRVFTIAFWVVAVLKIMGVLEDIVTYLDQTAIPIGGGSLTIWTLILAIVTVLLTIGIANWLAHLVHQLVNNIGSLSPNLKVVLNRVISIVFIILGVIIALGSVGINLTVLSVFGGAVGVGLGFGLQKIASNYISGFIILLDRSIKIGDLVTVADFRGRVTQINTRFTVVRSFAGVENIVPNEYFVTSAVQNHSYTEEATVQNVTIGVSYGANIRRALEIMAEEANAPRPRIDTSRRGWSYLDNFGDSSVNLTLGFWVVDPANGTASLKTDIALTCMERFAKEGIEIPFNQLDVNLRYVDAEEVPIRIVNNEKATGEVNPTIPEPMPPKA